MKPKTKWIRFRPTSPLRRRAQDLGRSIIRLRQEKRLGQAEAAQVAGLALGRWQAIEQGREIVSADTLRQIAQALGVHPAILRA